MVAPAQYLEAAKTDQLAEEMRSLGYAVERSARSGDDSYDLVATRGSERIAFEIKAQSGLGAEAHRIAQLRNKAIEQGFTEFRLVVVQPPRRSRIEVEGLEDALAAFVRETPPSTIDDLSSRTVIIGVSDVEVDEIEVTQEGTRVVGDASMDLSLEFGSGSESDNYEMETSLPLHFDVTLDSDRRVVESRVLEVDASSFQGD